MYKLAKFEPKEQQTALAGYLKTYRIDIQLGYDTKRFAANIRLKVSDLIKKHKKPSKIKFILSCKFIKENPATGKNDLNTEYFNSNVETITDSTDFYNLVTIMINYLLELVDQFQNQGSRWRFGWVEYSYINSTFYSLLEAPLFQYQKKYYIGGQPSMLRTIRIMNVSSGQ